MSKGKPTSAGMETSERTITIHVPLSFRRRGGRKRVMAPDGVLVSPYAQPRPDDTLVKAIARAYRWMTLLEGGEHATLRDLAAAEKISLAYVSRLVRLTLLSPEVVEGVLDGTQPKFDLEWLLQRTEMLWPEQASDSRPEGQRFTCCAAENSEA